jgi:catechol 2,3-dioxygenase
MLNSNEGNFQIHASAHIAHVEYVVRDLANISRFYGDLMGMQLVEKTDSFTKFSATGEPPALLTMVENKSAKPVPSTSHTPGLYHTAFRFPARVPLASTLMRFVAAGYPLQGAADHLFSEAVYLADPEGNGIELYRDRPRNEWPKMEEVLRTGNLPLDLRKLIDEADQASAVSGKVNTAMDIGHIHLQVSDLVKADTFYHQLLGLDVMISMPTALFFAAGGYHHHVGANTWHSLNAPKREKNITGLNSFAFEIPHLEGFLSGFERLRGRELPIAERDGKIGVALEDGDGIRVELLTPETEEAKALLAGRPVK